MSGIDFLNGTKDLEAFHLQWKKKKKPMRCDF
jgi:hypothetical protein